MEIFSRGRIAPCLGVLLKACLVWSCAANGQTPLSVVYTGRTLGYFRYPEQQSRLNFNHCIDDPSTMSDATRLFLQALRSQASGAQVLAGMGDNFAMDLNSRQFVDQTESGIDREPKDLWTWDYLSPSHRWLPDAEVVHGRLADNIAKGYGQIPADNVGCFLRYAKYDAIVPGNADFYYGPERLRMLARFLMSDQGPAFPKVPMLAANLAEVSTVPGANPRIPDYQREKSFLGNESLNYEVVQRETGGEPAIQIDLPDTVLPYLRKIVIHDAFDVLDPGGNDGRVELDNEPDGTTFDARPRNPGAALEQRKLESPGRAPRSVEIRYRFDTVEFCPAIAGLTQDPYKLDLNRCTELQADPEAAKDAQKKLNNDLYYRAAAQVLQPNTNWGVCLLWKRPPAGHPRPLCRLFSVYAPFLQYPADAKPAPPPYWIKDTSSGKVAIFGVVDPAVSTSIGRLNYGWLNSNPKYDTEVKVLDPAVALNQVLEECNAHDDCKNARKVLLAQMPAAAAANLAANIRFTFDLVISQSDDSRETGDVTISKTINLDSPRGTDARPPTLATPGSVYTPSSPGKIMLVVQKATVTRPSGCETGLCSGTWRLTNQVTALPYDYHRPGGDGLTLRKAAGTALSQYGVRGDSESWTSQQILARLALLGMQKALHADVALMQKRDLFEPKESGDQAITPANLEEMIDRVFWKNDYALPIPVTGATLKSLLKTSAAIAATESNSVDVDLERGRDLVPLGVFEELATKDTIVNAQQIQDDALYSAAVTDFLAFGDTGYTEFLEPAVPPALRMRDFSKLHSVAAIVCQAVRSALIPKHPEFSKARCGPAELRALDYEDVSSQVPFDTTSGYTAWRRFFAWITPSLNYHHDFTLYSGTDPAEQTSQQKPRFSFTVEKTDVSVAVQEHQRTLQPVTTPAGPGSIDLQASKFAGNPISQVTAPNSLALSFDNRTRFRWSGRRVDFFAMDDLAYYSSKTQNTPFNPNYARSLATNMLGLESGALVRLFPKRKEISDLKLLVSERLDTELVSPLLTLPLKDAQSSTYLRNLDRTFLALTKVGFRLEDERSWIEAGFEIGENFGLPYEYKFGSQVCPAGAGEDYHNALYSALPLPSTSPAYYPGDQSLLDCVSYYSYASSGAALGPPYLPPPSSPAIFAYSPLSVLTTNRREVGAFLNFSLNVPLPFSTKTSYLLENKGDIFANGRNDLPTDIHYFDQVSNSLLIAARGNLSIKPEFDIFAYEGKVNAYKIHTFRALLNLSYSFDWHSGLPLGRTMLYANPAPKTSTPAGGR